MNHKYKLLMYDDKKGEWKEICQSGNKSYLDEIALGLNQEGEHAKVEDIEE